ncbi:PREDICTED: histidine-rich glycoprotein [Ceratotherium simum simum]|uniref:Histidine-rich glycoprotein n=1 Tax=Ceratotherium simum simum TaxID=73337 RepID=A0ABM0HDA6_CERSS|nr:PREDICTED: histidine-rich glycoprotein [Ceratotherium simum simum]
MKAFTAALLLTLLVTLQYSWAVSPIGCDAVDSVAEKALDLINEIRRDGYLFQLLRITDAHLDKTESTAVYYLVLDVKESNCPVLSRKHGGECESDVSRRPSDIVIGQCKVIAATSLDESQDLKDLRVYHFNCTTSSVSSALANTKDSAVFIDFFEDTELYKKQADKALEKYKRENDDFASFRVDKVERVARARGGERTNYYVDFSVRNCSIHHFPRPSKVFGFCRAVLSYEVGVSDLETPEDIVVNCEVFNFEEHRYIHGKRPHLGHPPHSGGHEHSPAGKPPFKPNGFRDNHPHDLGCPPPVEGKDYSDRPPVQAGAPPLLPPSGSKCHHPHFGTSETDGPPHNHGEHPPHGPPPHGPPPHGLPPHGPLPHGPPPHGPPPYGPPPHGHPPHGPPPHGPPPHGPPPHGPPPHGPPPHGHPPHGHPHHGHHRHGHHPHGHGFYDHGPCDPPPHWGHGPPPRHPEGRGPGKGHFPFHWRQIGYVYRLPPLKKGEVLPLPEANFPSFSLPHHKDPLKPEIQPFLQSASESCPGKFKSEFLQVSEFFASTIPK